MQAVAKSARARLSYIAWSGCFSSSVKVRAKRKEGKNAQAEHDEVCASDLHMQCCFPRLRR